MSHSSAESEASVSTSLAVERTLLAYDRTLMANVRTSTALISFGFTIYKFFSEMKVLANPAPHHLLGSRNFGFMMVASGVIYVALSSLSYRRQVRAMNRKYGTSTHQLPLGLALLISILGILGLLAIIFRQ
jgi:inner membrane protein YidH